MKVGLSETKFFEGSAEIYDWGSIIPITAVSDNKTMVPHTPVSSNVAQQAKQETASKRSCAAHMQSLEKWTESMIKNIDKLWDPVNELSFEDKNQFASFQVCV